MNTRREAKRSSDANDASPATILQKSLKVKGCSETAVHTLLKIANPKCVPESDRQFRRLLHEQLPHDCVVELPVGRDSEGNEVKVAAGKIPKIIELLVSRSPGFAKRILNVIDQAQGERLHIIYYWDEVVGGNPLAPHSGKKVVIGYFSLRELEQMHKCEIWIPFLVAQHNSLETVEGGYSKMMREMVLLCMADGLEHGIPLKLGSNQFRLLRIDLRNAYFIADFDAIRSTFAWKGSAGLKCCFMCKNVVKRNSDLNDSETYLRDIRETNSETFDVWTEEEIFQLWDLMAAECSNMSKKNKETFEKISGYNWCPQGLLAHPEARQLLRFSRVLFDPMHIFWASGICGWEVVLLMNALQQKKIRFGCADLAQRLDSTPWWSGVGKSKAWRKKLADSNRFNGDSYRGSASDLRMLLPLFLYHCMECVRDNPAIELELNSLQALTQQLEILKSMQLGITEAKCKALLAAAENYLRHFQRAYSDIKPKHHFQLHLSQKIFDSKLCCDCFPQESKHRTYKYQLQNRFDPLLKDAYQFSEAILLRLIEEHAGLVEKPFLPGNLVPPVSEKSRSFQGTVEQVQESQGIDFETGRIYRQDFLITTQHCGIVVECLMIREKPALVLQIFTKAPWL